MKKILSALVFLLLFSAELWAQDLVPESKTANLSLTLPEHISNSWASKIVGNFTILDTTVAGRTITGTANQVTVTNGDGVSGNPTVSLGAKVLDLSGHSCEDAGSTDTYACTPTFAPASYITGSRYWFKANTANTAAASFNVAALGAKTIKKRVSGASQDLATNDIGAGQWVEVVYDGTDFQAQSLGGGGGAGTPGGADTQVQFNDAAVFGGDSGLTFNKTTNVLTVTGGGVLGDCVTNCLTVDTSAVTGSKTLTSPNANTVLVQSSTLTAGQFVTHIDSSGVQQKAAPAGSAVLAAGNRGSNFICTDPGPSTVFLSLHHFTDGTEANTAFPLSRAGTLKRLHASTPNGTVPAGETVTIHTMVNGAAGSLTCQIAAAGSSCNDVTNSHAVTSGQSFSFRVQCGGGTTAIANLYVTVVFE